MCYSHTLSKIIARHSLRRIEIKTFMIHIVGKSIDNTIFDNKKFNDDRKLNPFNFKTYGINFFSHVDDMQIPSRPIQPDLSAEH